MKVLLVEGQSGVSAPIEADLREAGYRVTGCDPADPSIPCRGLDHLGACPLDATDIDVAVVGREGGPLTAAERGALCASRRRIPVVVAGDPRNAVSFGPGTFMARDDLIAACELAAGSGAAHEAAVRRSLLISAVLSLADVDGDDPPVRFEVHRQPRRLRLVVHTAADDPRRAAITKAASDALRAFDPYVPVIDVVTATR